MSAVSGHPTGASSVEIRLPWRWQRTVGLVTLAVVGGFFLAEGIASGSALAAVGVAAYVFGVWAFWRERHLGVVASGDTLSVRNYLRSYRVRRSDIRAFRIEQAPPSEALRHNLGGPTVVMEMVDGSHVWLPATAPKLQSSVVRDNLATLQDWLNGD